MMTPNEAANLVDECYNTCNANLPPVLEDQVRRIQLDAYRAGGIAAAKVAELNGEGITGWPFSIAILAHFKNLKEIQSKI